MPKGRDSTIKRGRKFETDSSIDSDSNLSSSAATIAASTYRNI